jgi:hypothetical protein
MSWPSGISATGLGALLADGAALLGAALVVAVELVGLGDAAVHAVRRANITAAAIMLRRVAVIMNPPKPPRWAAIRRVLMV